MAKSGPPHSLASRRRDLSTKPWTGHQVENFFFADGSVVEIDAQILDWGAKSVPTEAQFSGSSPIRDESDCVVEFFLAYLVPCVL